MNDQPCSTPALLHLLLLVWQQYSVISMLVQGPAEIFRRRRCALQLGKEEASGVVLLPKGRLTMLLKATYCPTYCEPARNSLLSYHQFVPVSTASLPRLFWPQNCQMAQNQLCCTGATAVGTTSDELPNTKAMLTRSMLCLYCCMCKCMGICRNSNNTCHCIGRPWHYQY